MRTALVLGASRGIGAAVAGELASAGHSVIRVARSLRDDGFTTGPRSIRFDLMPKGAPEELAKRVGRPDVIVHVLGGSQGITDTWASSADWQKVWRLNLGIAHDLNRLLIPAMRKKGWGRVIFVSSAAPRLKIGYAPYCSAKGALEAYVGTVSKEVSRDGVIMSAVAPGTIYTEGRYYATLKGNAKRQYFDSYLPIGRFGRAEEVAKVVAFLASDAAGYMAGSIVPVDGGLR